MKAICLFLSFMVWLAVEGVSYAANTYANQYYTIREIVPFSLQEPVHPSHRGYTRLEFVGTVVWHGSGNCDTNSVLVRPEDKHILSLAMQAYAMSQPIRPYTDDGDTQKLGNVCMLRGLSLGG